MSAPVLDVPSHFHTFLAFDFGLKRTGVAVGNRLLRTAQPQTTIRAEGAARLAQAEARVREWQPDAIVVGDLGEAWDFRRLNAAFRQLLGGARLVALQRNRYWRTPDGLTIDAGAFVAALEYAASVEAVVVGKPSAEFFRLAAASLPDGAAPALVVGDDVETDIAGAHAAGLPSVLVRTGKFRPESLEAARVKPDLVLDSAARLEDLFGA